jgi:hypothetical protein
MKTTAQPPVAAVLFACVLCIGAAACGIDAPPGLLDGGIRNATGVCQHTCTPDPGPAPMTQADCDAAETGLEFLNPIMLDFEGGQATNMYSYTDNTTTIASFVDGTGARKTWQPPTVVMPRCGNASNYALHVQGGPFLAWGGGIGMAMQKYNSAPRPPPDSTLPMQLAMDVSLLMVDVSAWDGVSFWARRGPDSQNGIRVLVGDKHTDDDVAYTMYRDDPTVPRYCERVRECACTNHMECAPILNPGSLPQEQFPAQCLPQYPFPPGKPTASMSFCGAAYILGGGSAASGTTVNCDTCDKTRCDEPWPAYASDFPEPMGSPLMSAATEQQGDRQFLHKPCSPFTYRNGVSSSYCFDPTMGETPAEPDMQCGDHWTTPVGLGNNWQLYLIPFDHMIQQGWAKKFPSLDTTAASVVRFTWDGGWVDYYIDDVAFYRVKK